MATFEEWNERLVEYFFNPNNAGKEIRLDVDQELLDQEFDDLGGSGGFIQSIQVGPLGIPLQWSLKKKFQALFDNWYDNREINMAFRVAPSHMPYLCMFCYAWNIDDNEINIHNYMDRLDNLYPNHGLTTLTALNIFENQKYGIFDILPTWANHSEKGHNGALGFFRPKNIGGLAGVGWPLGQVIMSSSRKNRLGFLFDAIGVNPDNDIENSDLQRRLINHPQETTSTLGKTLFTFIENNDQDILDIVKSELLDWDGSIPVSMDNVNVRQRMANCTPLILLKLRHRKFFVTLTIDNDQERYLDGEFKFDLDGEPVFFPIRYGRQERVNFQNPSGDDLDFSERIFNSLTAEGIWKNESNESDINLKYLCQGFVFLKPENSNQLVQVRNLPRDGILYLLLNKNDAEVINAWNQIRNNPSVQARILLEFTNNPFFELIREKNQDCEIWIINGIEKLPAECLKLPLFNFNPIESTKYARLIGGYRVKSRKGRDTFFCWGPPQVSLENRDGSLILEAIDAKLKLISTQPCIQLDGDISQVNLQTYSLAPDTGKKSVQINVKLNPYGKILQTIYVFFLWNSDSIGDFSHDSFRINRLGLTAENSPDSYLSGVNIHLGELQNPNTMQINRDTHFSFFLRNNNNDTLRNSNDLITWLADYGKKINFSDACAFILSQQFNVYPKSQLIESALPTIMAMRQLGHIEIETDSSGRFQYVRPMPPCIYVLPFKDQPDYSYFALTGCYSSDLLRRLRASADTLGLNWFSTSQIGGGNDEKIHHLVPAVEILHGTMASVDELAKINDIFIVKEPPAFSVGNWASNLLEWEKSLGWSFDYRPIGIEVFQNQEFCFKSIDNTTSAISLLRGKDPKTYRIHRHQLRRITNGRYEYAFVSQREWGCWYSLFKSTSSDGGLQHKQPFVYFPEDGRVVTPLLADFPYLLSRALVLCSGLSPSYIYSSDFGQKDKEKIINIFPGYYGLFVQYYYVPSELANLVFDKVSPQSLPKRIIQYERPY